MAILNVVTQPAEILLQQAKPVVNFDAKLGKLLDDMTDTMFESEGVGIAGPQVNAALQVAIVLLNVGSEEMEEEVLELVNPEIIEYSVDTNVDVEGCLSIPGIYGDVERSNGVRVEYQDRTGATFSLEAYGYDARVIQHEVDHLSGTLFTTKTEKIYSDAELEEMYGEEEEE